MQIPNCQYAMGEEQRIKVEITYKISTGMNRPRQTNRKRGKNNKTVEPRGTFMWLCGSL